jgi:hypothetical protein
MGEITPPRRNMATAGSLLSHKEVLNFKVYKQLTKGMALAKE